MAIVCNIKKVKKSVQNRVTDQNLSFKVNLMLAFSYREAPFTIINEFFIFNQQCDERPLNEHRDISNDIIKVSSYIEH